MQSEFVLFPPVQYMVFYLHVLVTIMFLVLNLASFRLVLFNILPPHKYVHMVSIQHAYIIYIETLGYTVLY